MSTPPPPRVDSRFVRAMSAWSVKPYVILPGRDRVYGHMGTAMDDMAPLGWRRLVDPAAAKV